MTRDSAGQSPLRWQIWRARCCARRRLSMAIHSVSGGEERRRMNPVLSVTRCSGNGDEVCSDSVNRSLVQGFPIFSFDGPVLFKVSSIVAHVG